MTDPDTIEDRIDRVERIVDRLETEEVSLTEAKELRDEAKELLATIEADLDAGEGNVIELDEG